MSSEQQACAFAQYLEDEVQKDRAVTAVFLDATSAYDYVRHDVLLARLGSLFMPPHMWRRIRNFINNRIVHTLWGQTRSRSRVMRRDVPQDCSISPILWLAYISPLISYLWDGIVDDVCNTNFV
ncbi:conserved hypothetical protein [Perkinsus marinus ATCC 50983]|uniref:Reverse transcriptase domain-containing protein n=1 Tax=Perkinsus marinus (strain ATCC 50983 / TXsc) TaxID=423536 RepID=C5LCB6_PERM5|nr:conserved hypothetical protein [Perkinsus marinus ATCC 50983]EER05599.1 conserved hypothetical protein [Perkinsus marinus ATCC 50983]|eukprot:XP_002773783.1 conserved hypothetical protein [Perkinsus marinus ATCC 50983]